MRSLISHARWAVMLLGLPLMMLAVAMSTSTDARADRAIDEVSSGSFKVFETTEVRSTERSNVGAVRTNSPASRRTAASSASSDDDTPVRSRRGTAPRRAAAVSRASSDDDDDTPAPNRRAKGRQVASLGGGDFSPPKPSRSLSGGGNVRWVANAGCLDGGLRSAVNHVAANYGSVTVNSTCRSRGHNARVGGAPKSYHLSGDAVDLRVSGNISGAARYLASLGGGYKHYGGGLFHIDNGPRRSF
jgi:hypothetical protein